MLTLKARARTSRKPFKFLHVSLSFVFFTPLLRFCCRQSRKATVFYFTLGLGVESRAPYFRELMEKRQINFNSPLLSVRRYSSPSNSSEFVKGKVTEKPISSRQQFHTLNKSDWEIEEVTKPGAVPFHWEQVPGKPKCEVESQVHTVEEPLNTIRRNSGETPRLPPGRVSVLPSQYNSCERFVDQNVYMPQIEAFSYSDHANVMEKLNESLNHGDESDTDSGADGYSDALDTLSRASSSFAPSGTFSVDEKTRDLMMDRFLPAAKAVVLETPQYVVKKPLVVNEQQKEPAKKVVSGERKLLLEQYGSMPYYRQCTDSVESEHEDERSTMAKKSGKLWGILPRFRVKNSLCLFNPLAVMNLKSCSTSSSASDIRKRTGKAFSGPLDKNSYHVPPTKRSHSGLLPRELLKSEKKLSSGSNHFLNSFDLYKSGLSPLRPNRSGSISPYRNESPKSPFREGVGFIGIPNNIDNSNAKKIASSRKLFKALQDVSKKQLNERGPDPSGNTTEKTLYMDFVNKTELPVSNLSRAKAEVPVDISGERWKFLAGRKQMVKSNAFKSSVPETLYPPMSMPGNLAVSDKDVRPLECTEVLSEANFCTKDEHNQESDIQREFDSACLKSPLPPPLPKSPAESWLWRTLPSVSLGNPFSSPRQTTQFLSKKQNLKSSNTDSKWETIVKNSYLRQNHVRYSEEIMQNASNRRNKS
ncbi:uncharacterized protein LOC142533650 isoform X1 [Primulina tabacum]|uniref:uncharacterized protein LOC142533650 isoform X1 n=2 Tax=Primulina tabacum TaxID=48773 RepID=UPI003F594A5B